MMVSNTITTVGYWRVKRPGFFSWPHPTNTNRELLVTPTHVLKKCRNGKFQSVNGLVCSGINIPDDEVEYCHAEAVICMSGEMV